MRNHQVPFEVSALLANIIPLAHILNELFAGDNVDVQVCPLNPHVFASASDDGYLVVWDIRKAKEVTHARSGIDR
jgi:hypothetical protein